MCMPVKVLFALCRIMDVPDDLSWALFFYAGAASVVGQSYTGAVLYIFFTGNTCSTFEAFC